MSKFKVGDKVTWKQSKISYQDYGEFDSSEEWEGRLMEVKNRLYDRVHDEWDYVVGCVGYDVEQIVHESTLSAFEYAKPDWFDSCK